MSRNIHAQRNYYNSCGDIPVDSSQRGRTHQAICSCGSHRGQLERASISGGHIVNLFLYYLWAHKQKEAGGLGSAEGLVIEEDDEDGKWENIMDRQDKLLRYVC